MLLCVLACLKTAFKFLPVFSLIHTGIRRIFAYKFKGWVKGGGHGTGIDAVEAQPEG